MIHLFILYASWVTELVKVDVSLKFIHRAGISITFKRATSSLKTCSTCFPKSLMNISLDEHCLLTLKAWTLKSIECLLCSGCDDVKCNYWCLHVPLMCTSVVKWLPNKETLKSRKMMFSISSSLINLILRW